MRWGAVAIGMTVLATTAPAQRPSPEAGRLMRAAAEQGMRLTAEEAERLAARQREIAERLGALGLIRPGGPAPATMAPTSVPAMAGGGLSEAQLGAAVDAARRDGTGVKLDGTDETRLVVDGRRHVDPEGELANVAADAERNAASFLVGRGDGRTVKFAALTDLNSSTPVGEIIRTPGGFAFEGRTGVRIAGRKFTLLPDGLAMWRDDALFLYRYGAPVASHALPDGYYPAQHQRGDVGGTGLILLRRDRRGESADAGALRAARSLFAMAGIGRKASSDFTLFDTRSAKLMNLPIEDFGQDGPLLGEMGQAENTHYFWKADWLTLGTRRFAVHRAKGMQRLLVTDLDSGKTVQAFERGLGITSWHVRRDGRGSGRLVANWMFRDHAINDLVAWFDAAPALPAEV